MSYEDDLQWARDTGRLVDPMPDDWQSLRDAAAEVGVTDYAFAVSTFDPSEGEGVDRSVTPKYVRLDRDFELFLIPETAAEAKTILDAAWNANNGEEGPTA